MFSVFTVLDNIASFDAELILLVCSKALICHCCNRVCVFVLCPLAPVSPRSFDERLCTPASSQTYAFFFIKIDLLFLDWSTGKPVCFCTHYLNICGFPVRFHKSVHLTLRSETREFFWCGLVVLHVWFFFSTGNPCRLSGGYWAPSFLTCISDSAF